MLNEIHVNVTGVTTAVITPKFLLRDRDSFRHQGWVVAAELGCQALDAAAAPAAAISTDAK